MAMLLPGGCRGSVGEHAMDPGSLLCYAVAGARQVREAEADRTRSFSAGKARARWLLPGVYRRGSSTGIVA
eukprot:82446-Rhodomonas_salina.2